MQLWQEEPRELGPQVEAGATLEYPDGRRDRLWYRVPVEFRSALTELADPFVIGTLFAVMEAGRAAGPNMELRVRGQVTPSLLRNLEEFQTAWSMWLPELYARVPIRADLEREPSERPHQILGAMCFSGGVDSAFTAYRHSKKGGNRHARPLAAGVMVQGMEFRLDQTELYQLAEERSRRMLDSLGLELIRVVTNFKEINSRWGYCHGAAVASCLAILQNRFGFGLIAQTMTYANNHIAFEGVNPTTDWLLSSDSFPLIPDGAGASRLAKILALKDWPEFLENVRVCAQDETRKAENCCECGKCIRTILQFRTVGLGLPPAFPRDVPLETIENMVLGPRGLGLSYEPLLEEIRKRGLDEPWTRALERAVKRSRRAVRVARRPRWAKLHHLAWQKVRMMLSRRNLRGRG